MKRTLAADGTGEGTGSGSLEEGDQKHARHEAPQGGRTVNAFSDVPDPCAAERAAGSLQKLPDSVSGLVSTMISPSPASLLEAALSPTGLQHEELQAYIKAVPKANVPVGKGNHHLFQDGREISCLIFAIVGHDHAEFLRFVLSDERVKACAPGFNFKWSHVAKGWCSESESMIDDGTFAGVTLLQHAASLNAIECLKVILGLGVEKANCKNTWEVTALHLAAWYSNPDVVYLLLGLGARPCVNWRTSNEYEWQGRCTSDMGCTPLHCALLGPLARHAGTLSPAALRCMELLLDAGADVNAASGPVSAGVRKGPNATACYSEGSANRWSNVTPLHLATVCGSEDAVRLLLARGAKQTPIGFEDIPCYVPSTSEEKPARLYRPLTLRKQNSRVCGVRTLCLRGWHPSTLAVALVAQARLPSGTTSGRGQPVDLDTRERIAGLLSAATNEVTAQPPPDPAEMQERWQNQLTGNADASYSETLDSALKRTAQACGLPEALACCSADAEGAEGAASASASCKSIVLSFLPGAGACKVPQGLAETAKNLFGTFCGTQESDPAEGIAFLLPLVRRGLLPVLAAGLRASSSSPISAGAIDEGAKSAMVQILDTTFPKPKSEGATTMALFLKKDMDKALEKWAANSGDSISTLDPEGVMQFMLSGEGLPSQDGSACTLRGASPLTTTEVMIIAAFESMLSDVMEMCYQSATCETLPISHFFDALPSFKPWRMIPHLVEDDELRQIVLPEFAGLVEQERSATVKALVATMREQDADWISQCQEQLTTHLDDTYLDTRLFDDAAAELTKALCVWGTGLPKNESREEFCTRVVDRLVELRSTLTRGCAISEKALWEAMGSARLIASGEHRAKHHAIVQPHLTTSEPELECGEVLLRLGYYAAAESCFLVASSSKEKLLGLGEAAVRQGDLARALEAFVGALQSP